MNVINVSDSHQLWKRVCIKLSILEKSKKPEKKCVLRVPLHYGPRAMTKKIKFIFMVTALGQEPWP